ncbi:hypothetical protein LTR50_001771 [Elasticomyces elasticus]|nr:hypothetical protein LTR50_001771 [Elasticomyces elasticus]
MIRSLLLTLLRLSLSISTLTNAQSATESGYIGFNLSLSDPTDSSLLYATASTAGTALPAPDVHLNATVHVRELDLSVTNLTAKLNLDARVLQLLRFNAGVALSIDRVRLLLANVSATALLEVRLENVAAMIDDALSTLNLNPVLATAGQVVGGLANSTAVGALATSATASTLAPRFPGDPPTHDNILYTIHSPSGTAHTHRILTQQGFIVDRSLDRAARVRPAGDYLRDMVFSGRNRSAHWEGVEVRELEYLYAPFEGLSVVSRVFVGEGGEVVGTRVGGEGGWYGW